jgi:transcriptional regulator with XRE-family HTH domain
MTPEKRLAIAIKKRRQLLDLKQKDLAAKLNLSQSRISQIERMGNASGVQLIQIAKSLNTSVDAIAKDANIP